ncbi:hypothetical protein [Flaviaesturariibacter aridisoli]|uniref:Uncharacterized protein n=1 Tax=Flaviaesturariibacter aridisoli TaxID=2545761 RepID=A0A4R4E181_9BACT|nr:hypothetical protein [Flaviaesturariibacter aridisoli]TCZ72192.1 hypothetical protein E0486_08860 [Flaviaesturariibacter aridisoli]
MKIVLAFLAFVSALSCAAQGFNQSVNKDSLLQVVLKDLPESRRSEMLRLYNQGNEKEKEFILVMLSMPRSSKKELIANIEQRFDKILLLKDTYRQLVPKNYFVSIEFNPADNITMTDESIDLKIEHRVNGSSTYDQQWNLRFGSDTLARMIGQLGWTAQTLNRLKKLLAEAHCVSIENGPVTTIGYARSGMGKYSYLLFAQNLTPAQIEKYNDGCTTLFYKKNMVLKYGGGAVGPQCFPDRD